MGIKSWGTISMKKSAFQLFFLRALPLFVSRFN